MRKFWQSSKAKLVAIGLVIAVLVMSISPINVSLNNPFSHNQINLTMGYVQAVYATGSLDFALNGVTDDVPIQAALNALPATGGRINIFNPASGNVTLTATVSRAIPNVTIVGSGGAPLFKNNGIVALFSVGGQTGWKFSDLSTDAGGITLATDTVLDNVHLGTSYYALRSLSGTESISTANFTTLNAPTGRGVTYVIASVDAPALEKSQADAVSDGVADDVELNAAITLGYKDIYLSQGSFNWAAQILPTTNLTLRGAGYSTVINLAAGAVDWIYTNSKTDITLRDFKLQGNNKADAAKGIYLYKSSRSLVDHVWIDTIRAGVVIEDTGTNLFGPSVQNSIFSNIGNVAAIQLLSRGEYTKILANTLNFGTGEGIYSYGAGNVLIADNDITHFADGIYIDTSVGENPERITISGNHVNQNTTGIYLYHSAVVSLSGNSLMVNTYGLELDTSSRISVTGGLANCNTQSDIYLINSSNNTIQGVSAGAITAYSAKYSIEEGAGSDYNNISNNVVTTQSTGSILRTGANSIMRGNIGYVTENSGTGTMAINTGNLTINHGLSVTPTRVLFNPTSNPGLADSFWVDTLTSTQFTIHATTNVTTATTFNWRATVGEGN